MHRLIAFLPQRAAWCWMQPGSELADFVLVKNHTDWFLEKDGERKKVSGAFDWKGVRFVKARHHGFFVYEAAALKRFGRSLLEEQDPNVSASHFSLEENRIQDLGSANGLYVNGKKVSQAALQCGDEIMAGTIFFYWHEALLLISAPLHISRASVHTGRQVPLQVEWQQLHNILPPRVLEPARIPALPARGDLFAAAGSSLLIVVSMLAVSLISALVFHQPAASLVPGILSSLSMACAFVLYGILMQKRTASRSKKERAQAVGLYQAYVNREILQIQHERDMRACSLQRCLQAMNAMERLPDGFPFFCLLETIHAPGIQLPNLAYDQKQEDWALWLQDSVCRIQPALQRPLFLQPQEIYSLYIPKPAQWIEAVWQRWLFYGNQPEGIWQIEESFQVSAWMQHHPTVQRFAPEEIHTLENSSRIFVRISQSVQAFSASMPWLHILTQPGKDNPSITPAAFERLDARAMLHLPLEQGHMADPAKAIWHSILVQTQRPDVNLGFYILEGGKKAVLSLDEKAQGPHMLCAGMTGSGKSEFLSSMLLQLCLFHDSAHLQFMVLDFKGGALSQAFYTLPHFAGSISNLNVADLLRFEKAMRFELEMRQKKINDMVAEYPHVSAHIDTWNEMYPGDVISHIMVFVDEFAQIQSVRPESMQFMKELARIGRSLGIHIVLSTQKTGGVVDEQILANTDLKVCFKTSGPYDSREMLKSDIAAGFDRKGQGAWITASLSACRPFQSLYAKEQISLQGRCEIDGKKAGDTSASSILKLAIEKAAAKSTIQRRILPDFYTACHAHAWLVLDNAAKQSLDWLVYNSSMHVSYLVSSRNWARQLAGAFSVPCYGCNLEEEVKGVCRLEKQELYLLEYAKVPSVLFLQIQSRQDLELVRLAQGWKHVLVISASNQSMLLDRFAPLRLAEKGCIREEMQAWIPGMAAMLPDGCLLAQYENQTRLARVLTQRTDMQRAQKPQDPFWCKGYEADSLVPTGFAPQEKLCIAWMQADGLELAKKLMKVWQKLAGDHDSVTWLELTSLQDIKNNADIISAAMSQSAFLFLGSGYENVAMELGSRMVLSPPGGAVCVKEGQTCRLERLESN